MQPNSLSPFALESIVASPPLSLKVSGNDLSFLSKSSRSIYSGFDGLIDQRSKRQINDKNSQKQDNRSRKYTDDGAAKLDHSCMSQQEYSIRSPDFLVQSLFLPNKDDLSVQENGKANYPHLQPLRDKIVQVKESWRNNTKPGVVVFKELVLHKKPIKNTLNNKGLWNNH